MSLLLASIDHFDLVLIIPIVQFGIDIVRDIEEHVDHQDHQDVARHSPGLIRQEEDSQQNVDLKRKVLIIIFEPLFKNLPSEQRWSRAFSLVEWRTAPLPLQCSHQN